MGDFIEMYFDGVAGLCRAVAAFGAAGRLVGEKAHAFKFVAGQRISNRLQRAGVVGGCDTVGAIGAAIQE